MRYITILKLAVGALIVFLIARHIGDFRQVAALLADARLVEVSIAILALAVAVALNALRWRLVLTQMGASIPFAITMAGTFEGMFFNLFLPTGVGGDAVRAYRAYDFGLGVAEVVHSALIDRALGLWGLALFVLLVAPFSGLLQQELMAWTILGIAVVIVAGGIGAALLSRAIRRLALPDWLRHPRNLVVRYGDVVLSRRFRFSIVPILLASNLATCLSAWFAFRAIRAPVAFPDAAAIIETASMSALLPLTIGGWGLREGVVIVLLERLGLDTATAAAGSALVGLTVFAMGVVGAAIWYVYPYQGRRGRWHARRAARTDLADAELDS